MSREYFFLAFPLAFPSHARLIVLLASISQVFLSRISSSLRTSKSLSLPLLRVSLSLHLVEPATRRRVKLTSFLHLSFSSSTAKRVGEAKVIAARAEVDAARLMRTAADILASPAAMSIRTLDALTTMARQANSKVIFGKQTNSFFWHLAHRIESHSNSNETKVGAKARSRRSNSTRPNFPTDL